MNKKQYTGALIKKQARVIKELRKIDILDERLLLPRGLVAHSWDVSLEATMKWDIRPVRKVGTEVMFYLPEVIAFREGYRAENALNPQQEKAKLDMARREKVELDLQVERGELVRMSDIISEFEKECIVVRQRLLALPSRSAKDLSILDDPREVQEYLVKELSEILEGFGDARRTVERIQKKNKSDNREDSQTAAEDESS